MTSSRNSFVWRIFLALMLLSFAGRLSAASYGTKRDSSAELFTNGPIPHLKIEITSDNLDILRTPVARSRNTGKRPWAMATVREGDHVWTNVAIHLKGSYGSFQTVDQKPSLTLNFDKHVAKQRFHGLEKISLNNGAQDPSYLSEKICRELYAAAGVPVPRVDYATVELNRRQLGLFVLAEGWNKQFLKRHFSDTRGNFYDGSHDVSSPKEAEMGDEPTNHAALLAVTEALKIRDHGERIAALRGTVDLDRFLSLHALDVLMWNWDGYGMGRNNYRMFHDRATDRVVVIPHGVDQMFWKPNGPIVTGRSGLIVKGLLETREGRDLYLARFSEIRSNLIDVAALTNRIAQLSRRIAPALVKQGIFAVGQQNASAQQFSGLIRARLRDVDAQLDSVKSFQPIEPGNAMALGHWDTFDELGNVTFATVTNGSTALRVHVRAQPSLGGYQTTMWLEEGRYRIEGRVKTVGVQADSRVDGGAGFRVWSTRKETRGASWSWFPYASGRDPRLGGLIPPMTNAPQQRLTGDNDWKVVSHEFELRQPLADIQLQCVLQASSGAAWFDLNSLKIRRVSRNVSKTQVKGE